MRLGRGKNTGNYDRLPLFRRVVGGFIGSMSPCMYTYTYMYIVWICMDPNWNAWLFNFLLKNPLKAASQMLHL